MAGRRDRPYNGPMRLVESPPGMPFERPPGAPAFEAVAAFGPGRRYWTMAGMALIAGGRLSLVLCDREGTPARVVVDEPVEQVRVIDKPRWSFGTGLYLGIGDETYTLEPEPIAGRPVTRGRIRGARNAVRDFERALAEVQAPS